MFKTDVQKLRNALEFTRIYKENANDIYLREAACMDFQLRHILVPMDENDGIAGRYEHDFVGFSSQVGGIYTYYFNEHEFLNAYMACKQNGEITAAEDYALQAVQAYWHEENTARKVELEFSKRYGYVPPKAFPGAGVGNCDCRVAGTNLDFEKLARRMRALPRTGIGACRKSRDRRSQNALYKACRSTFKHSAQHTEDVP